MELFSSKFGLPGFIGITALLFYFFVHFQAGLAGIGTIALFVTGMVLIFLEFFLPGAIAGTIGVAALISSLFIAGGTGLAIALSLVIAIFLSILFFYIMVRFFGKKIMLFNKMVLLDSARKEDGYVTHENRTDLLGMKGIALTTLRPSGTAVFGTERVDVVSEGGYIEKSTVVKVIKVEGVRIVVRESEDE